MTGVPEHQSDGRVLAFTRILGCEGDEDIARRLHEARHAGMVEEIVLATEDMLRHRLRVTTDRGTDGVIALRREEELFDGAVLLLEEDRVVVVRTEQQRWLTVTPRDPEAALELGYFAGAIHWKVRIEGGDLHIALDGAREPYLDRLELWVANGRAVLRGDV